jgi:hypothetical protein
LLKSKISNLYTTTMSENVSLKLTVAAGQDVPSVVNTLKGVGVDVKSVVGQEVNGEVYFTKVSLLNGIPGIQAVHVVGTVNPPVAAPADAGFKVPTPTTSFVSPTPAGVAPNAANIQRVQTAPTPTVVPPANPPNQ